MTRRIAVTKALNYRADCDFQSSREAAIISINYSTLFYLLAESIRSNSPVVSAVVRCGVYYGRMNSHLGQNPFFGLPCRALVYLFRLCVPTSSVLGRPGFVRLIDKFFRNDYVMMTAP